MAVAAPAATARARDFGSNLLSGVGRMGAARDRGRLRLDRLLDLRGAAGIPRLSMSRRADVPGRATSQPSAPFLLVIGLFFESLWLAAKRGEERFPETLPDVDEVIQSQAAQLSPRVARDAPRAVQQGSGGQGAEEVGAGPVELLAPFGQAFDEAQSLLGEYGLKFARTFRVCRHRPRRADPDTLPDALAPRGAGLSKLDALQQKSATGRWLQPIAGPTP